MLLTTSKGSNDMIQGSCTRTEVFANQSPPYKPSGYYTTEQKTTSACIGSISESRFNRTKGYRPGAGTVNPVIHFKNHGSCTVGAQVSLYHDWYGYMLEARRLQGHIAAFVQQNSTPSYVSGITPSASEYDALAKAIGKAVEPKAQLGVTLGELPETISMFHDPIQKLAHEGHRFRKLLPRNVRAISNFAMNAWLQVRYGVMPLLGEIDTYRNVINEGVDRAVSDLLKEKAGWRAPNINAKSSFVRDTLLGAYAHGEERYEKGTQVSATAYYRRSTSIWQSNLGVDVSALLPTLWELVPYSFVLDWFIDVGGWLQRLSPNNSVMHIGNCLSVKSYDKTTTSITGLSLKSTVSARYPITGCSSVHIFERTAYTRDVNLTLPVTPLVNYRNLGLARQIDSVSLALQRVSNLFQTRR